MTAYEILSFCADCLFAGVGTFCFAVLFCVPKRHYFACACNGALALAAYRLMLVVQPDVVVATLVAALPLTIAARVFAVYQKAPITVFLFCGIFPLVPGANLYYTAYYFMHGENALCLAEGIQTLKIAIALAISISIVLAIKVKPRRAS